jgi:hypothetical protein
MVNKSIQNRPRIAARFLFEHLGAAADAGRSAMKIWARLSGSISIKRFSSSIEPYLL